MWKSVEVLHHGSRHDDREHEHPDDLLVGGSLVGFHGSGFLSECITLGLAGPAVDTPLGKTPKTNQLCQHNEQELRMNFLFSSEMDEA